MVKKQLYEAPEAELLTVRFEENIRSGDGRPGGDDTIIDDEVDY